MKICVLCNIFSQLTTMRTFTHKLAINNKINHEIIQSDEIMQKRADTTIESNNKYSTKKRKRPKKRETITSKRERFQITVNMRTQINVQIFLKAIMNVHTSTVYCALRTYYIEFLSKCTTIFLLANLVRPV